MIKETMTRSERMEAAVRLEPVDRIPTTLLSGNSFAYKTMGLSAAEAYRDEVENPDRVFEMQLNMYEELGLDFMLGGRMVTQKATLLVTLPHMRPGVEFPNDELHQHMQVPELEVMREDEYDKLLSVGWDEFWLEQFNRVSKWCDDGTARGSLESYEVVKLNPKYQKGNPITWDIIKEAEGSKDIQALDHVSILEERGIPHLIDGGAMEPVAAVYFMRTIPGFMHDLYHNYDKVKAVIVEVLIPWFLELITEVTRLPDTYRIFLSAGWFAPPMVSKKAFEELQWAWLYPAAMTCIDAGITPVFHLDSDWTEALPYFKELPKGKFILQLDGTTDMCNAKKMFRNYACFLGDVPAAMLTASTPREIERYVKNLIDVVGKDNGFMLSSGCMVPGMAKVENVRAMIDTAKNYMVK